MVVGIVFSLAFTIALVGFWMLWLMIRTPNLSRSQAVRRIYLYEHGFVSADRPDDPQVYRWDDIDTVYQKIVSRRSYGIETSKTYLYTITRRDGRTLKLTQFWADIVTLGPHINESVSMALLPVTLAAIDQGQGVQFGDMTLTADGIAGQRRTVSWAQVRKMRINNGYVSVDIEGRFLPLSTTAAAKLPNLPLFFALAERLLNR
jgi:hypothetical protein